MSRTGDHDPAIVQGTVSPPPRWEGDVRGHGVVPGTWIVPEVERLHAALIEADWIAEQPELHLQPHLDEACQRADSPWTIDEFTSDDDGVYIVRIRWARPGGQKGHLRADVFALIGTIAESVTFVHQMTTETTIEYRVTTGMFSEESPFAGHGHLILLQVVGADVDRLLRS